MFNFDNFVAPTPRTLREDFGMLCRDLFSNPHTSHMTVALEGVAVGKNYLKSDYASAKELLKELVSEYANCTYIKGKVYNDFVYAQVKLNNKGDVNMTTTKKIDEMMTRDELRDYLELLGKQLSNTLFNKTNKKGLIAMINEIESAENIVTNGDVEYTPVEPVKDVVANPVLLGQEVLNQLPTPPQAITMDSLAAMMLNTTSSVINDSITNASATIIVPAVNSAIESANAKVLAELKAQLDTMNATISAIVNTNRVNPTSNFSNQTRPVFGKCEDCGCDINEKKVVDYSQSKYAHTYCRACQKKHNAQPSVGSFGTANQTQQQPTVRKYAVTDTCMCCGKAVGWDTVQEKLASAKKAQAHGLKPVICGACAKKILAERATQQTTGNAEQEQARLEQEAYEANMAAYREMQQQQFQPPVQNPNPQPPIGGFGFVPPVNSGNTQGF